MQYKICSRIDDVLYTTTPKTKPKIPNTSYKMRSTYKDVALDFVQHTQPTPSILNTKEIAMKSLHPTMYPKNSNTGIPLSIVDRKRKSFYVTLKDISFVRRPYEVAASCSHPLNKCLSQNTVENMYARSKSKPIIVGKHHLRI